MPLSEDAINDLFNTMDSSQIGRQLLHAFATSGEHHLAQMEVYAQQGDNIRFLERVHAFKGSAATLGVQCVVSRCKKIEAEHEHLDCASMSWHAQQLRSSLQQDISALEAYLQKRYPGHSTG